MVMSSEHVLLNYRGHFLIVHNSAFTQFYIYVYLCLYVKNSGFKTFLIGLGIYFPL